MQLLLVSLLVANTSELVAVAKVEYTGQRVSTDIAGRCASKGSEENVGSVWRVSWPLEDAGRPLGHQVYHCRLPCKTCFVSILSHH